MVDRDLTERIHKWVRDDAEDGRAIADELRGTGWTKDWDNKTIRQVAEAVAGRRDIPEWRDRDQVVRDRTGVAGPQGARGPFVFDRKGRFLAKQDNVKTTWVDRWGNVMVETRDGRRAAIGEVD